MPLEKPAAVAGDPVKSAKWDELTAGRSFTQADAPTLALLCQWYKIVELAQDELDSFGEQTAYQNDMGDLKSFPQIATLKTASAEIRQLNKQLGITDGHEGRQMSGTSRPSSSRSPSATRRGRQEPRYRVAVGEAAYSEGEDAAELGGDLGMEPIEWQSLVLSDWCACDAEGRPAYVTCGLDVPRQNGKNAVIEIYEVFRLAVCGWHILHTAHRVKTAKKAFNRLVRYFTDKEHPELSCLVERIRRTNGEEAIYLTNGGSIEFSARTNGSARGFDDIQLVVFDEAQELTDSQYDAIMYTLAASATGERQIIYTGTPPNEDCPGTVFARTRAAILAGDIPSTEWCSWATDECPRQDATFDDVVDLIYESNPSMGIILSLDFTRTEFAGGSITGFAHERLGWFSPAAMLTRAIPRASWDGALIDAIGDRYRGKKAFGVKFSRDGSTYALSGCKLGQRTLKGKAAVELIRVGTTAGGARELAEWLYDRRATASVVVIDGMSGADALIDRLAEMKPPRGYVVRPQTRDVVAAAVGFVDALNDGTLAHTYDPTLEESARKCVRRKIGSRGGWGFGSPEDATVPPEPLESCSLALWGARTTKRNPRRKQRTL